MNNDNLYKALLEELQKKNQKKSVLVNSIANLLIMEKESVYRRLRGDVPFTLIETGKICKAFNVSLDRLIFNNESPNQNSLFRFNWVSYEEFDNPDYNSMVEFREYARMVNKENDSECGFALNSFSNSFFAYHHHLYDFLYFKRIYRRRENKYVHYEDITPKEECKKLMKDIYINVSRFKLISYVWDANLIYNLVNDIKYFESINLIEKASIELIKSDLHSFLDRYEKAAFRGTHPGSDALFEMYISNVSIGQTCSYIGSSKHSLSTLNTFELQTCTSTQRVNYEGIKEFIRSLKGVSTQISVAGEKERIRFFNKQKEFVETL